MLVSYAYYCAINAVLTKLAEKQEYYRKWSKGGGGGFAKKIVLPRVRGQFFRSSEAKKTFSLRNAAKKLSVSDKNPLYISSAVYA